MAGKRNPSFEILRVVAMFLIVVWHFLMHGVGTKPIGTTADTVSLVNLCAIELAGCLAKVSTNCYILITGYFIIRNTQPKWEKIPKTWAPIFFYSVVIFAVCYFFGLRKLKLADFGESLLPIYFNKYWFATHYVALIAMAPFLARIVAGITRRQYAVLLAVLGVINFDFLLGKELSGNNSMMWFIFLFFTAGYIRLYFKAPERNRYGRLYFLSAIVLSAIFLAMTFHHYSTHTAPMMTDYHKNNGIIFISALLLFLWAASWKAPDTHAVRWLAAIAPMTFGVYLIHDNALLRPLIWHRWLNVHSMVHKPEFIPLMIGWCVAIYLACTAIDAVRDRLFRLLRVNERIDRTVCLAGQAARRVQTNLRRRFNKL